MKLVITLAGHSNRFTDSGYCEKSFIDLFGKNIIQHVVSIFSPPVEEGDIIFVARKDSDMSKELLPKLFPESTVIFIEPNKDGPVVSLLSANLDRHINDDEEVIVSYCDFFFAFDLQKFLNYCRCHHADGAIIAHNHFHPHRVYNSSFCYLRVSGPDVLEVKEKACFTDNAMDEPASSGVYYFKYFYKMIDYFNRYVVSGERVNNEFYVTMPFNLMIKEGKTVIAYETDNYVCLGTPKDLELLKAWKTIIDTNGIQNQSHLIGTYNYWKRLIGENK